ncbi:hypothetical protein L6164_033437 [Bauhinia variegata]|uniref:Uncharacterized protein n=1 Tax=Bauhinia variegata TaxID=167791 RepID=A0ACB9KRW5_BAUVA|nr:hypothetical protein L6164_033437 [Bauhinia variegata]
MEYERIEKVQTGIISPSKLRMKLAGSHHQKKKNGSNSNSSRTSPSRLEDTEFVNNSLLNNLDDEVTSPSLEILPLNQSSCEPKEAMARENVKMQHFPKGESCNSGSIYALRVIEDENLDYDSNASSSSFEFQKEEKQVNNNPATKSLLRPLSSKWNDAEKWIMNKQSVQGGYTKKNGVQSQANRPAAASLVRVAPESANYDYKLPIGKVTETKRIDFCQPILHLGVEKFSFVPSEAHRGRNLVTDSFPESKDLKEVTELDSSYSRSTDDKTAMPGIRSVAMRDMGTEMTPIPSQEPSRTATPAGSTPLRSPISSMPSTPREGALAPTPSDLTIDENSHNKTQLSEEELKVKTRREIAALGMQLGKMNIAAWASQDEQDKKKSSMQNMNGKAIDRIEFKKRANSWEEAEKARHTARYKREVIRIRAWESQKKATLEAEMRRIEAKIEQMRAQAQAKMVKKVAMARQRSEEKRAAAETRKNREAEKIAAQADYIRRTGRMPSSNSFCCGWLW